MKLSITILSSILAVCSVTVANPVDPSSTMSAEASVSTASPDVAIASGSVFTIPLNPYMADCHPITSKGIKMIGNYADSKHGFDSAKKQLILKKQEIKNQKKGIKALKEQLDSLSNQAKDSPDPKDIEESFYSISPEYFGRLRALEKLEKEWRELSEKYKEMRKVLAVLKSELYDYLVKHDTTGSVAAGSTVDLESIPGFKKCFKFFYNRSLRRSPQSGHGSGSRQRTPQS
ncbi:hypothetical protein BATDEDRAFT_25420 [Batrachochytrium dendrobatidis JAM81]|uniref:Uncharacterized protein n=1 Tax=Batrachochytrium dendrobatidis (strain JAM81 / FGSC 10211) TaxID=684364 RepID=F4P4F7_BATDJ|nr:uncharacterized protein BATDEDRAFT_25420 [Batrachochytrium dendrobatidis JAM81]EGF79914.1 hypothetical protein BATDEDRAFT_25420 [Batrachochytrium dendrobatidis JAM81]|eukprot:XP_006679447.1 hypothetical protein BATDEDRAFT_25420 [Batrachochytrium dendrobatidis JAM81]